MKTATANGILLCAILFVVIAHLLIKWRVMSAGPMPTGIRPMAEYFGHLLINPWVILAYFFVLLAALGWMAALSRLELSYAYPLLSLTYVGVVALSSVYFGEPLTAHKLVGLGLIIGGVLVIYTS